MSSDVRGYGFMSKYRFWYCIDFKNHRYYLYDLVGDKFDYYSLYNQCFNFYKDDYNNWSDSVEYYLIISENNFVRKENISEIMNKMLSQYLGL